MLNGRHLAELALVVLCVFAVLVFYRRAVWRLKAQALSAQTEMLMAVLDNSQLMTYVKDLDGRYLMTNEAFQQAVGFTDEQLNGRSPDELVDSEVAQLSRESDRLAVLGLHKYESWIDAADGRHSFEVLKFPLHDSSGKVYGIGGVSRDITDSRRATAAVNEARDTAVASSAAKSSFLATMSHEIRTPMNAVIGMTDLLTDTDLDDQQQEFVETIRSSGAALLTLINDILDFSKIEAGELHLAAAPFDLRDEIERCLDLVTAAAQLKGLDLVCYVAESAPSQVLGDAPRLRQILVNLLSNAVKFTSTGEVLITAAAVERDGRVAVTIDVTDTGIGISAEGLTHLFQSFSQVDASDTRRYGGTGLGLAISRRLAEAMDGDVRVHSTPGVGSTFTVDIVLDPCSEPVRAPGPEQPVVDLSGLSVLVVDDHPTSLRILDLQLSGLGLRCTSLRSPEAALELVRDGLTYDVAILDMRMPGMDGVQLATALASVRRSPTPPNILLTSVGSRPPGAHQLFSALLAKPVKSAALHTALSHALSVARSRPAAPAADGAVARVGSSPDRPTGRPPLLPSAARPLRVLLAEDNPVNQRVAQLMLTKLGHDVDTAGDGLAAVAAATSSVYDVILMDIQMPQLNGIDAARRIRGALPADAQPRIIAMTASALLEDRDSCVQAGMDSYLTKPVRAQALMDALDQEPSPERRLA